MQLAQREALGKPDLPIIGGRDCEAATQTPPDGEGFKLGGISVKGLYTPCHTQDSICWFAQDGEEKVVFTGDTLFHGGGYLFVLLRRLYLSCNDFVMSSLMRPFVLLSLFL